MDGRRREQAQVLHPGVARDRLAIGRLAPPEELGWSVDYGWWVVWDTPEPHVQEVIPRPVVHVAAERWDGEARLVVTGVPTGHFRRELSGRDRTVAVAFRPGGFRPFLARPASGLVDLSVPVEELDLGPTGHLAADLLDPDLDVEEAARMLLGWFAARAPDPDPLVEEIAALVLLAEQDPAVRRAEQLAARAGVSLRTLQRRFREYVGPGPKWVVQRARLLDVVEAAHAGTDVDWGVLAGELGYADQSHLIQHFRTLVGHPPARYVQQQDPSRGPRHPMPPPRG